MATRVDEGRGFQSTTRRWYPRPVTPATKLLVDAANGHVIGIQNPSGQGGDFVPYIFLTQTQIDSPPQAVLDDIDVTYILDVSPYDRYRSNGTALIGLDPTQFTYIAYGQVFYGEMVIESPDEVIVSGDGELRIIETWPT